MNHTDCLSLALSVAVSAAFAAVAAERVFPEPPSRTVRQRMETLDTFRLLERDIRYHAQPREERDINGNTNVPFFQPPAEEVVNEHALIWPQDRDPLDVLLRRTRALADDLAGAVEKEGDAAAFATLRSSIAALESEAKAVPVADEDARFALFERAMRLRRRIAFSNPLLKDIDKLLFITRETPTAEEKVWGTHMCDQYFGFHATLKGSTHGNGLWTLEDPFGDEPRLVEMAPAGTVIHSANPQWNNLKITAEGGFLAPDVSWDGKEILFCWTPGEHRTREWDEKTTFHIMKMRADGSHLEMLTWGGVNDLFPCWLPNGRIMFVSERRGGYGRCHMREVPNFTLHSMFPDGTDMVCLSPHETNEWEPSVDNDGMVVYTRWDYTDRGFNQAHHAWITYPDGRDPRELNGNTRKSQRRAPHLVQSIRAIPGSRRYVGVSGGHHTPDRGSLVLLDPSVPDDGEMSQVKRLTPDELLPESEKLVRWPLRPSGCYGAPWPLSEKYYICTYDGGANDQYSRLIDYQRRKYRLTLLDAFGNKICIFEHPTISCADAMPLKARPMPPVIPHRTLFGRPADADGRRPEAIPESQLPQTAAYGLVNVYNSRYPFPPGTKISALRVWQVFPKLEPMDGHPRLGAVDQMGGRQCLGTVPVELDGSAHFNVPVKTPVYFQALDENGCAVQTMRTVAYAQAGERLTCNGCHESRHGRAAAASAAAPMAFRRPPSELKPEPEGSRPFNYPTLVQPVLDARCVACHGEKRDPAKMPDLRAGDIWLNPYCFNTSFIELVGRGLVHYYTRRYVGADWWAKSVQGDDFVQPYSEPGKAGALASPLYAKLKAGHKGVRLTDEEMRRLVVFMDSHCAYISHDTRPLDQCLGRKVEGVNFPPPRSTPVLADRPLLVVGDSIAAAMTARTTYPRGRNCAVVVPGAKLSDATRAIYGRMDMVLVENAEVLRVERGRAGFVTGVVVRMEDGREVAVRGMVVFDATGDGRICRETGAPMEDGHFLPGPAFCYPYLPQGSHNVIVADATAAVPREEVPRLLAPEGQKRIGEVLAVEVRSLTKAINGLFSVRGR